MPYRGRPCTRGCCRIGCPCSTGPLDCRTADTCRRRAGSHRRRRDRSPHTCHPCSTLHRCCHTSSRRDRGHRPSSTWPPWSRCHRHNTVGRPCHMDRRSLRCTPRPRRTHHHRSTNHSGCHTRNTIRRCRSRRQSTHRRCSTIDSRYRSRRNCPLRTPDPRRTSDSTRRAGKRNAFHRRSARPCTASCSPASAKHRDWSPRRDARGYRCRRATSHRRRRDARYREPPAHCNQRRLCRRRARRGLGSKACA